MYHCAEVVHDAELPLEWVPTSGNNIPAHAIPAHASPDGQLYIARGTVGGEMQLGTTSHSSTRGACLYGQNRPVYEYEVLTCASNVRFHLEPPKTPSTAPPSPPRNRGVSASRTPNPAVVPPNRAPSRGLNPFPWINRPHDEPPRATPEKGGASWLDPPPYTSPSPKNDWIDVPKHPLPVLSSRERVQLKHLTQSKCFVLIDDSSSMKSSWSQTREALSGVVDILSRDERWDGLDVRFLHHREADPCIKTPRDFEYLFDSVRSLDGVKEMASKVEEVFEDSVPLIDARPVVFLIITDDVPTDTQELLGVIVRLCQELKARGTPRHVYRIHMLQMGDDRRAVEPLHEFRDRVTQRDRNRRILEVVSFHRGRGLLDGETIVELLIDSTYIPDDEDPELGERPSVAVVKGQHQTLERIRAMGSSGRTGR